jgi:hypothetical protein
VRKLVLVSLLIAGLLVVAVVPLKAMLSNSVQSPLANSSAEFVPSMLVPAGVDKDHNGVADSLDQEISVKLTMFMYPSTMPFWIFWRLSLTTSAPVCAK